MQYRPHSLPGLERQAVKIPERLRGAGRTAASWQAIARWWPFAALCLLESSRWLLSDRWPEAGTSLASASAGCGAAALALYLGRWLPWGRAADGDFPEPRGGVSVLGGVLLFGGPLLGLVLLPHGLESAAQMVSMALTPVVAGVACAALGEEMESVAGMIWPGLAALAGFLLVLPEPSFLDPTADAVMLLGPVMTGVGAALLGHQSSAEETQPSGRPGSGAVLALSAAALLLGAATIARGGVAGFRSTMSTGAALMDGVAAAWTLLSVRRLGAMRYTSIFVLAPLIVLVEGLVLLRPPLTPRTEFGLLLLLLSGIVLAVRDGRDEPAEGEGIDLG